MNTYSEPRQASHIDGGFGIVPIWVMESDITTKGRLVYMALASCAGAGGQAWPSIALLVQRSGLSRASVKRGLKELEEAGMVRRERRYAQSGSEMASLYWLQMQVPPQEAARPDVPVPDGHGGEVYVPADPGGATAAPTWATAEPQNIQKNKPMNRPTNNTPISPLAAGSPATTADAAPADAVAASTILDGDTSESDSPTGTTDVVPANAGSSRSPVRTVHESVEQEFEEFWGVFPRERRTAKRQCKQKFTKAVKDGTPPSDIIDAARRYADDPNRFPAYTASPLTWLNQGRWADGPLPPRNGEAPATTDGRGRSQARISRIRADAAAHGPLVPDGLGHDVAAELAWRRAATAAVGAGATRAEAEARAWQTIGRTPPAPVGATDRSGA